MHDMRYDAWVTSAGKERRYSDGDECECELWREQSTEHESDSNLSASLRLWRSPVPAFCTARPQTA